MDTSLIKSRKRAQRHGEVFTPGFIVNNMLDLVKQETEQVKSRFLEPACGNGNFLVEILRRKLEAVKKLYKKNQFTYEFHAIIAISSIYGIDILKDNIEESRERLFDVFDAEYIKLFKEECNELCRQSVKYILSKNILTGDTLTLKTVDKEVPIILSEWTPVSGSMIKRRDFTLEQLMQDRQCIKDFPPVHFSKISKFYL